MKSVCPTSFLHSIQSAMTAHVALFNEFLYGFEDVRDAFGRDVLIRALRRNYLDCCCAGDVVMNRLIDALDSDSVSTGTLVNLYEDWKEEDLFLTVLDNLVGTLEDWWMAGECRPNVWWAS